jgi:hypothetical protein
MPQGLRRTPDLPHTASDAPVRSSYAAAHIGSCYPLTDHRSINGERPTLMLGNGPPHSHLIPYGV